MLRKAGPDEPAKYNYHFKHMTTVGEPIEPEVWKWYYEVVGKGEAAIVDTYWQTETGGICIYHHAGPAGDEARQRRSRYARHPPDHL
jgi:acyl-coenzyme A synthetase/AMP-(fatty) acid ligase